MKQALVWFGASCLGAGTAFGLLLLVVFALDARAQDPAPAEPDTEEVFLVPAALWTKMRDAVLYWHDEAQRYKAMKGCA